MNNQVCIFFAHIYPDFSSEKYEDYYATLPSFLSNRVKGYKKYSDQILGVLGKHLLLKCMAKLGLPTRLTSYNYDVNKRPFLKEFPNLDFNISHSGNVVICAASLNMRLGIDVEQIKPIQLSNFRMQFSNTEWKSLQETANCKKLFFQYWVKKEAVAKTDGSGLFLDFSKLEVTRDRIYYKNIFWLFTPISIRSDYLAFLATNKIPSLHVKEVHF